MVFEGISGQVGEDLLTVKETLHRIPGKGVGYLALAWDRAERDVPWISFNYLGEMDAEKRAGCQFLQQREI